MKVGDWVINSISPSMAGEIVNIEGKVAYVKFPGHGSGFPLPLDQLELAYARTGELYKPPSNYDTLEEKKMDLEDWPWDD